MLGIVTHVDFIVFPAKLFTYTLCTVHPEDVVRNFADGTYKVSARTAWLARTRPPNANHERAFCSCPRPKTTRSPSGRTTLSSSRKRWRLPVRWSRLTG
jgi:hypothetical protein